MTLLHVAIFSSVASVLGLIRRGVWRRWSILIVSLLTVYLLQPATPLRHADFWFPSATIALTVLLWAATRGDQTIDWRSTSVALAGIVVLVLAIGATAFLGRGDLVTVTPPPAWEWIVLFLTVVTVITVGLAKGFFRAGWTLNASLVLLISMFLVLKTNAFSIAASRGWRSLTGQPLTLAVPGDFSWLGFSYAAFRMLHTVRERQIRRLPALSLEEYATYVLFFPAFTAGPIDRVERFVEDLRTPHRLDAATAVEGSGRVLLGVFKKFVLADTLAILALNEVNVAQVHSSGWIWILLYGYALRLYLDFSGYTDVAIGMGRLLGVNLPENFDRPYWKGNLTTFWNSWHITLAQWFRAYAFNPLTRRLRQSRRDLPAWTIILVGQVSTMVLIGLWHGVTWNFTLWGLWHGLGLFVHNRWTEWKRRTGRSLPAGTPLAQLAGAGGTILTFHFVTLGWVWFALPQVSLAIGVYRRLVGLGV